MEATWQFIDFGLICKDHHFQLGSHRDDEVINYTSSVFYLLYYSMREHVPFLLLIHNAFIHYSVEVVIIHCNVYNYPLFISMVLTPVRPQLMTLTSCKFSPCQLLETSLGYSQYYNL